MDVAEPAVTHTTFSMAYVSHGLSAPLQVTELLALGCTTASVVYHSRIQAGVPKGKGDAGNAPLMALRVRMVWYGMVWYGMVWYGMVVESSMKKFKNHT